MPPRPRGGPALCSSTPVTALGHPQGSLTEPGASSSKKRLLSSDLGTAGAEMSPLSCW